VVPITHELHRHAALPENQRTFGDWLRQVAQFAITPLSPGFDLDRYDRELRGPSPSEPQLAPESTIWRREHVDRRFVDVVNGWNS
jgi:NAD(P)H dehydrogenase (quinone)